MNDFIEVICSSKLHFIQPVIIDDLVRIGDIADGGYAINLSSINQTQALISLGLGENWSFESAFSEINPDASIDIYDDTVSLSFFAVKAFKGLVKLILFKDSTANFLARLRRLKSYYLFWMKKSENQHHNLRISKESFEEILHSYPKDKTLGLKVDIEGSEWEILNLISENFARIEFLLIEIHDFDKHQDKLKKFLSETTDELVLCHLHANNFESLGTNGFPKVFEITLIRAKNVVTSGAFRAELPIVGLDVPNAKNLPDFRITFS